MMAPWSGPFHPADTSVLTGLPLENRFANRFREKRWCYAGVVSPEIIFGMAVVHLGYITSAFCFGFDRDTGQMAEKTLTYPPLGLVRYDRHPERGACAMKALGQHIEILSLPGPFTKRLHVRINSRHLSIRTGLTLSAPEDTGFFPMHFPMDMGEGRKAFTTKAAGLAAKGRVSLNGKEFELNPDTAFGLVDWTHGAYPRNTFWNWACGAGIALDENQKAIPLGFNFSRGVYENGQLENTLWISGQPVPVPEIRFDYDPAAPLAPWQIASEDQRVALTFHPEGLRSANDNFGLVASKFIQPCGRFEGRIRALDGRSFTLSGLGGVVEEHDARW